MPAPSRLIGYGLAEVIRLVQVFRRGRPVHPSGVALVGHLQRIPAAGERSGIAWLDEPGIGVVRARYSRGLGLPESWPDILGLALRVEEQGAPCDVLLASTGVSTLGRFLVFFRRRVDRAALGSMMPYKGSRGPIVLSARTLLSPVPLPGSLPAFRQALDGGLWRLGLYWARPSGHWFQFGILELQLDPDRPEHANRHDPVLNAPPGARTYDWTRNLRERSYRLARRFDADGRHR
jgi:hypothetical protein